MSENESKIKKVKEILDRYRCSGEINIIVELGARDCLDTLALSRAFAEPAIHAFECNEETLPVCRQNVKSKDTIVLVEKAALDRTGEVDFYSIDTKATKTSWEDGNPGASSVYKASDKYPVEKYVQNKTTVRAVRLDEYLRTAGIDRVDMLWLDIQGSELLALKGMGDLLNTVKIIHTEMTFTEMYKGQPLHGELKSFLNRNGFALIHYTYLGKASADAVFLRVDAIHGLMRKTAARILNSAPVGFHRCLRRFKNIPRKLRIVSEP